MDRGGGVTCALELLYEPVRAMLRARKDNALLDVPLVEEVSEQASLVCFFDKHHLLVNALSGRRLRDDLNMDRRVKKTTRELDDVGRHRSGE